MKEIIAKWPGVAFIPAFLSRGRSSFICLFSIRLIYHKRKPVATNLTLCGLLAYDDTIMKKTIYKISFLTLVIFLLLPSLTFAAWWNPLSWFGGKNNPVAQSSVKEAPHQDLVVSQLPAITAAEKQVPETVTTIISPTAAPTNNDDQIKTKVVELIQQYLPPEELERVKSIADHTTASYDLDKAGLQLAYIPGSMVADDGTSFSATHLSSSDFTTGSTTLGDTTVNGGLSVQGSLSAQNFTTSTMQVGSGGNPVGITLYDADTSQPLCLKVKSGVVVIDSGNCN